MLLAPTIQELGGVEDRYSVAGAGGVVAGIAGNEGIDASSNGHLEKRGVVRIGEVGS
jgi:hypothetical protein